MSFPLPPDNSGRLPSSQPFKPGEVNGKTGKQEIDEAIEQTIQRKLPTPQGPIQSKPSFWDWLFGKKKEEGLDEGEILSDSDDLGEETGGVIEEEIGIMGQEVLESKEGEVPGEVVLPSEKRVELEKVAVKTYEAAKQTKWQNIKGVLKNLGAWTAAPAAQMYLQSYQSGLDKEHLIALAKQEMLNEVDDPQFVEFYEMAKTVLSPAIKDLLDSLEENKSTIVTHYVLPNRSLIVDLIEINLARGFVNLARQVKENQAKIPNYGQQPTLVSIFSLLSQNMKTDIDAKKLAELEQKYREPREVLQNQIKKLFPEIEANPEIEESIQKYIQEYIRITDKSRKEAIKQALFPLIDDLTDAEADEVDGFFETLDILHERYNDFHELFGLVTDDILHYLFPKKFVDMEVPAVLQYGNVQDWIYNSFIRDLFTDLLQRSYEPLENDLARNEAWKAELEKRVGVPDLKPIVDAPAALFVAFAKNFIQADPKVMDLTTQALDKLVHPKATAAEVFIDVVNKKLYGGDKLNAEQKKIWGQKQKELRDLITKMVKEENPSVKPIKFKDFVDLFLPIYFEVMDIPLGFDQEDELIAALKAFDKHGLTLKDIIRLEKETKPQSKEFLDQLSQQQLANWVVESVQSLLHTTDPHLTGLGEFVKQSLNNLALALMAKGAKVIIPEDEQIEPDAFIKELSDRLVEKFSSLGEKEISEDFWKIFVKDLPLPSPVKGFVLPKLIENSKDLQKELKKVNPDFQEIQKVYAEAEGKILSYEGGKELLSITEKVSDQIIEKALEQNIGLVTTLGLGDTIEELFAQYLPGVTINNELKIWFKENISALGITEKGDSPQSIILLKQGVQAVLRKAMVNTIEKNFKNNSKDYAAQLLKNFHQAFEKVFTGFDDERRKEVDSALKVQAEIEKKNNHIEQLKQEIAKKPAGISTQQFSLLDDVISANTRVIRASNYIDSLIEKRDKTFDDLNAKDPNSEWDVEDLPKVSKALVVRKIDGGKYKSIDAYQQALESEIKDLENLLNTGNLTAFRKNQLKEDLANREVLLEILFMSSEELRILSEAINVDFTLKHAQKELIQLKKDLQTKQAAIDGIDENTITNLAEWKNGKKWMELVLKSRQEINKSSQEINNLEKDLDAHLGTFQALSEELTGLLGLDQKEKLDLPPFLQDKVWPYIQSAKKQQIARFLFVQITPLLLSISNLQQNKDKLTQLSKGDPFLGNLIQAGVENAMSRIPDFVTSYKPFAKQILIAVGNSQPSEADIARMEVALNHLLIALGKNGTTASMLKPLVKGFVPEAKEDSLSLALETLIAQLPKEEFSADDLFTVLEKEVPPANKKEEQKLKKQAHILAKNMNRFLFNRGKGNLKPQDLVDAYRGQIEGNQKQIQPSEIKDVVDKVESTELVEKFKTVVITPEEIAIALNDVIPGATDLHTLIAPQLQAVIVGDDPTFNENREILQRFLEGAVLRLFIKIAEANQGKDVLTVVTQKLIILVQNAQPVPGRTAEEVARQMIDQVIEDVLGLKSKQDLESFPLALRQVAYEKVKEVAYQQLTPLILPIIERSQSRDDLKNKSGSNFLGDLCQALSKDVIALLPVKVQSYRVISKDLLAHLLGQQPTSVEVNQFADEIASLVKEKNVKNHLLIQAFAKVTKQTLDDTKQAELKEKLIQYKAKDKIDKIWVTPEKVAGIIGKAIHLDDQLQQAFADELQGLIHENPEVYKNISDFAAIYVESVLLKMFIRVAEKNPQQGNKETLIVLTEKILDIVTKKYQELKSGKQIKNVAEELNDAVMKDLLGIDSADAFKGLPDPLKKAVYGEIKDRLSHFLISLHTSLSSLDDSSAAVKEAKEKVKKFGIAENASKGYAQILAEDIANMAMDAVPYVLTEISGTDMKGVTIVSKVVEKQLEELARGNMEIAKVLLNYTKGAQFQQILRDNIAKLADKDQLADDRKKVADLMSNLLIVPMSQVIEKAIKFEEKNGAEFNQKLMVNFLQIGVGHLRNLNAAEALAAQKGQTEISHQDFVEVAGDKLHPGVPKERVTYEASIAFIGEKIYRNLTLEQQGIWKGEQKNVSQLMAKMVKKESQAKKIMTVDDFIEKFKLIHLNVIGKPLTLDEINALKAPDTKGLTLRDSIRQEAEAPNIQRQAAYGPSVKMITKMLFPNGKNDLTFVSEELRGTAWKMLKKEILPQALPLIAELILEPMTINKIVLNCLEAVRDNLSEEIVLEKPEPEGLPLDALDEVGGELIVEVLKATTLPGWIKNFMVMKDPKTGEIVATRAMKKTLGSTFRKQFNDTFIKDKLQMALEKVVQRNKKGEPFLKFDTSPKEVKKVESIRKPAKIQAEHKKVSRELVDVSISYFIRKKWVVAQARFDDLVEKAFGKIGTELKQALDAVFRFVFFTMIGSILSVLFWPMKQLIKESIYSVISLDKNRDDLLAKLTKAPADQPVTSSGHVVYNEDAIFKISDALNKTIREFIEEEPIVPISQ